jgi:phosphoenolpyruvate carboxykinase (ATP)
VNQPLSPAQFQHLFDKARAYVQGRELFVFDGWAGADPRYRLAVRVITEKAWHCLFARTLFRRPTADELAHFQPEFTVLSLGELHADPATDGTRNEVCVALGFERRLILIVGTIYAGEMKKSIFSVLNYRLPQQGVFPMHCAANIGPAGDTALFFGLSGTGKTTLSADPHRRLIGDDEHGWSDEGIFNLEGGCYAKTIRLSREGEPQIWNAIRFGSVLENVVVAPDTRQPDYHDHSITENTRATYPVEYIANCELSGRGGHPANILFLTCDAFGVLPPISKLNHEQAVFHFLSGYTAKVAGTEAGVTEPEATFSTCFGAPFLPLHPARYGEMLKEKLKRHGSQVWLVNTGWIGGSAGQVDRIKLSHTRAMVNAALSGQLAKAPYTTDPVFGLAVPQSCPNVPSEILRPRNAWKNPAEYEAKARRLGELFQENIKHFATKAASAG